MSKGAAVQFAAEPNTLVDFLDAGLPGTLPVCLIFVLPC